MRKRTFTIGLNVKDIEKLKKQLIQYRDVELPNKMREVVTRLANLGIPVIEEKIAEASYEYDAQGIQSGSDTQHRTYVDVKSFGDTAVAKLILEGREVLFIEYGSGTYYNTAVGTSPHPLGEQYGYLIGSYGLGNGAKRVWGYYSESGELVLTRGTKATMPMYHADQAIILMAEEIIREVFA